MIARPARMASTRTDPHLGFVPPKSTQPRDRGKRYSEGLHVEDDVCPPEKHYPPKRGDAIFRGTARQKLAFAYNPPYCYNRPMETRPDPPETK